MLVSSNLEDGSTRSCLLFARVSLALQDLIWDDKNNRSLLYVVAYSEIAHAQLFKIQRGVYGRGCRGQSQLEASVQFFSCCHLL